MAALPRLFVAAQRLSKDEPLRLLGAEHHYLSRVLRLSVGDHVLLLDGGERQVTARVAQVGAEEMKLERVSVEVAQAHGGPRVTLYMGLLKGDRHDLVLQKATELGARRIVTVACRRSVPNLKEERGEKRRERWLRIVQAASQQCRRPDLPEVTAPLPLPEALRMSAAPGSVRLLLYEGPAPPLRSVLQEAQAAGLSEIELLVGPEGGFEAAEVEQAMAAGFLPCSLGPRVLRAETAALAALAVLVTG